MLSHLLAFSSLLLSLPLFSLLLHNIVVGSQVLRNCKTNQSQKRPHPVMHVEDSTTLLPCSACKCSGVSESRYQDHASHNTEKKVDKRIMHPTHHHLASVLASLFLWPSACIYIDHTTGDVRRGHLARRVNTPAARQGQCCRLPAVWRTR